MTNKRSHFIAISLSLILLLAAATGLQAQTERKGVGFNVGYSIYSEDDFNGNVILGLHAYYRIVEHFKLELRSTFNTTTVHQSPNGFSEGGLQIIPIQLSLHYVFTPLKTFSPYVGGGVGYYLNNYKIDYQDRWLSAGGFDLGDDLDNTLGFHAGGGFELRMGKKVYLNVDVRYAFIDLTGSWSIRDVVSGYTKSGDIDENIGLLTWNIGASYRF